MWDPVSRAERSSVAEIVVALITRDDEDASSVVPGIRTKTRVWWPPSADVTQESTIQTFLSPGDRRIFKGLCGVSWNRLHRRSDLAGFQVVTEATG